MSKKFVIILFIILSQFLSANYNMVYLGSAKVIRDNREYDIKEIKTIINGDKIATDKDTLVELEVENIYYYIGSKTTAILNKAVAIENGVVYKSKKKIKKLDSLLNYDKKFKLYADPYPFYSGKAVSLYVVSSEDINISKAGFKNNELPIIKFFKTENAKKTGSYVYKTTLGIYVGWQQSKLILELDINLKNGIDMYSVFALDCEYPELPKKPKQIQGVNNQMTTILSDREKSAREREFTQKIYTIFTPTNYIDNVYLMPAQGRYSSPYGAFRGYTANYARFHEGFDIANTNGSPIYATGNGIVRLSRELFVRGNCVIIDHGHGVFSSYFHMSKLIANEGSFVKRGDIIGLIGSTGMSTGPHLHWEMRAGNITFDPLSILEKEHIFNPSLLTEIR